MNKIKIYIAVLIFSLFGSAIAAIELACLFLLSFIFDNSRNMQDEFFLFTGSSINKGDLAYIVPAAFIVKSLLSVVYYKILYLWIFNLQANICVHIYNHFQIASINKDLELSEKIRLLGYDVSLVSHSFILSIIFLLTEVIVVFIVGVYAFSLFGWTFLVAATTLLLCAIVYFSIFRKMPFNLGLSRQKLEDKINQELSVGLKNASELLFSNLGNRFVRVLQSEFLDLSRVSAAYNLISTLPRFWFDTLLILSGATAYLIVSDRQAFSTFDVAPLILMSYRLAPAITRSTTYAQSISYARPVYLRLISAGLFQKILTTVSLNLEKISSVEVRSFSLTVGINKVTTPSFHAILGDVILITGKSGSGKSKFLQSLLSGANGIDGSITINETYTVSNFSSIREKVSYVAQESFIIKGSILDNADLSATKLNMEEIRKLALNLGLDTIRNGLDLSEPFICENGENLSGGQRQRISIFRALVKSPDVLVLDEATAALDKQSERAMMGVITHQMRDGIVIYVAHGEKEKLPHTKELIIT